MVPLIQDQVVEVEVLLEPMLLLVGTVLAAWLFYDSPLAFHHLLVQD